MVGRDRRQEAEIFTQRGLVAERGVDEGPQLEQLLEVGVGQVVARRRSPERIEGGDELGLLVEAMALVEERMGLDWSGGGEPDREDQEGRGPQHDGGEATDDHRRV